MNHDQIIELFVRAASVDRKLPDTSRPARDKAINYGAIHDTADINGWSAEDKHANNWAWLDPKNLRNTTSDMGIWEVAMEVVKLVPCAKKRRALWAWSISEAGGQPFAKWCRHELDENGKGISRQTGNYRRTSAIECIERAFARKPLQHNDIDDESHFTNTPETDDKRSNIGVWRANDAKPICGFDAGLDKFDWAATQNERRRQREARKREAA